MRLFCSLLILIFLSACGNDLETYDNANNGNNDQWGVGGNNTTAGSDDCPDPDAEEVYYYTQDPEECALVDPVTPWADEFFNDECGCGYDGHVNTGVPPTGGEPCEADECGPDEYCYFADGQCGDTGVDGICQPLPTDCTDDVANICGCDGVVRSGSSTCVSEYAGVDSAPMSFCSSSDCPDPDDPEVIYYGDSPENCAAIDFICDENQTMFNDECGCGCIGAEPPPPGDECFIDNCPEGEYCHYDDGVCGETGAPGVCTPEPTICTDDIAQVCGCDGTVRTGSSSCVSQHSGVDTAPFEFCGDDDCPDPDDEGVEYVGDDPLECMAILFACEDDQTEFNNECGCGCIDDEPECPDPDDDDVDYYGESVEECAAISFVCPDGEEHFDNECGCGCIDNG